MEFSDIERILELVRQHDLAEFELEKEGLKLRVRKTAAPPVFHAGPVPSVHMLNLPPGAHAQAPPAAPSASARTGAIEEPEDSLELAVVKSPIVGTFYRSPEPGSASFVEIG